MKRTSADVYVPVCVRLTEDGRIQDAFIEFEGYPSDWRTNIWDTDSEEWEFDEALDIEAIGLLSRLLYDGLDRLQEG